MTKQFCIHGHDTLLCGRTIRNRCKLCRKAEDIRTRKTPKEILRQRNKWLRTTYGITVQEYNRLFQIQGGMCAICKKHQSELKQSFHVDHDHTTMKVRGLLCFNCNSRLLPVIEHYSELFEAAKTYLQENH